MLYYTNILTLYDAAQGQVDEITAKISGYGLPLQAVERTIFFGTRGAPASREIQSELAAMGLSYSFLFVYNPDGSEFYAQGISGQATEKIKAILFEDIP